MADANAQRNAAPYFLGERTIQAGKKAGIKEIGLILIANDTATKIGLPMVSGLPQTVGGIKYEMKNRAVFAEGSRTKDGKTTKFSRIVRVKRGSKALKLYLNSDEAYSYTQQGKTVTGRRPKSVQIGVPSWAAVETIHNFLVKATNVVSFSLGGGIYTIKRGGV
jgi:hypothetical protein